MCSTAALGISFSMSTSQLVSLFVCPGTHSGWSQKRHWRGFPWVLLPSLPFTLRGLLCQGDTSSIKKPCLLSMQCFLLFCTFRSLPAVSYLKVPFFNLLYAICFFELFFFPGDWHIQPCFNFLRFPEHTAGKGPSWSYQKSSLQFCAGHINVQH